jgi:hypothetical protein
MNWEWWLPGTPEMPPAAGMFVQMMDSLNSRFVTLCPV